MSRRTLTSTHRGLGWRLRRPLTYAAAFVAAAVLVPTGTAALVAAGLPALPTLYVVYAINCTFSIVDDQGKKVTSIAPGTYQVDVTTPMQFKLIEQADHPSPNDFTGCKGWVQFQLTGPGVNLFTTLTTGCDSFYLLPSTYYAPNSTYTALDLNQPAVTKTTFTTLASGTPVIPTSPYLPTSSKGFLSTDLIGSSIGAVFRGALAGTVSSRGASSLAYKGKAVSTLKAGRYRFSIDDRSARSGFTIRRAGSASAAVITRPAFVGRRSVTVLLRAGLWTYGSSMGATHRFAVGSRS